MHARMQTSIVPTFICACLPPPSLPPLAHELTLSPTLAPLSIRSMIDRHLPSLSTVPRAPSPPLLALSPPRRPVSRERWGGVRRVAHVAASSHARSARSHRGSVPWRAGERGGWGVGGGRDGEERVRWNVEALEGGGEDWSEEGRGVGGYGCWEGRARVSGRVGVEGESGGKEERRTSCRLKERMVEGWWTIGSAESVNA